MFNSWVADTVGLKPEGIQLIRSRLWLFHKYLSLILYRSNVQQKYGVSINASMFTSILKGVDS
ncbi:hypothetical protein IC620_04560 [Hazenella sp. IB182357]|uniref:Uncharacterized protein n=1 Tax=Polycladospora coralii TaxID=2771432 RepID=A0A926N5C0_9BACL|nr:hypothetical protein [Polycladospora coralii]MBD1371629.1 hypothetical protein [Polycladospora coralii]